MALAAGDKLGPYEVLAPIGAGGMGEVYKARDRRLERTVAIKVLPEHIARRDDARARFEREARAVASLNHPHICTLHDIGPNYMVMELIEGETLAARIEKGALPIEQALRIAIEIADALDRAHRAGVTHRDIKPQNVMLTRDGVKLLDFGLAKSAAKPGVTEETLTKALTAEGTVVGTPQYMAPEQFEGQEADARSDIWAFGAVLYEMVTGQKAFRGRSYSSLVAAILSADPPPMAVSPVRPVWLDRLVRRCLQKDPEDRYQCVRDIVLDLKSPPAEIVAARARSGRWLLAAAAAGLVLALMGWGFWLRGRAAQAPAVAFSVEPPPGTMLAFLGTPGGSAISPDGRTLAFVARNETGEKRLYVRPLESLAARALAGTEDAGNPFWSPDSKTVAFFTETKLKRIDVSGGPAATVCDGGGYTFGDWNEDGVILVGPTKQGGIQRVPASGGSLTPVTRLNKEAGENLHLFPRFLPGGREFLYRVRNDDSDKTGLALGSLDKPADGAASRIFARMRYEARYDAASGHLVFMQNVGNLVTQKMELRPPRLVGDPVVLAEGVRAYESLGYAEFSLSRQGTLLYGRGVSEGRFRFGWRDRSGKLLRTVGEPVQGFGGFSLSPDGTRVAYQAGPGTPQSDVWVMDLSRGLSTRISLNRGTSPQWSPDGKFIYYNNANGIYRKAADGSGEEMLLARPRGITDYVNTVSPDGTALLFGASDIMRLSLTAGGTATREALPNAIMPRLSPDGRWLAYSSNESGRAEIYIEGYPHKGGKVRVSAKGGTYSAWRPNGKELYWIGLDGTVMAAATDLQPDTVRLSPPQELFRLPVIRSFPVVQPSRDGQQFLVYEPESATSQQASLVVIQNWAARLKERD